MEDAAKAKGETLDEKQHVADQEKISQEGEIILHEKHQIKKAQKVLVEAEKALIVQKAAANGTDVMTTTKVAANEMAIRKEQKAEKRVLKEKLRADEPTELKKARMDQKEMKKWHRLNLKSFNSFMLVLKSASIKGAEDELLAMTASTKNNFGMYNIYADKATGDLSQKWRYDASTMEFRSLLHPDLVATMGANGNLFLYAAHGYENQKMVLDTQKNRLQTKDMKGFATLGKRNVQEDDDPDMEWNVEMTEKSPGSVLQQWQVHQSDSEQVIDKLKFKSQLDKDADEQQEKDLAAEARDSIMEAKSPKNQWGSNAEGNPEAQSVLDDLLDPKPQSSAQ